MWIPRDLLIRIRRHFKTLAHNIARICSYLNKTSKKSFFRPSAEKSAVQIWCLELTTHGIITSKLILIIHASDIPFGFNGIIFMVGGGVYWDSP